MSSVLVVEDDSAIAALIAEALRDDGFEVATVGQPAAALEYLLATPPDVLLFDLRMQGMDGRDFYTQARERGSLCPAILVTAWSEGDAIARSLDVGYLRKPFDLDELSAAVRAALSMEQHAPSE